MHNREKKGFLPIEKREELLKNSFVHLDNVVTDSSTGLVVDVAEALNADVIIKGLRSSVDFEIEMQMAQTKPTKEFRKSIHSSFQRTRNSPTFQVDLFVKYHLKGEMYRGWCQNPFLNY